jgi:hypothetical protein
VQFLFGSTLSWIESMDDRSFRNTIARKCYFIARGQYS